METEFEAQFAEVGKDAVRARLKQVGATLVHPERLMRRRVFNPRRKDRDWFRVRDEGDKVTMSYKKLHRRTVDGVEEVTVTVDDFETACTFLETTGVVPVSYQETKRESWLLGAAEVEIDEWPWIPPFVEIEGANEEEVRYAAEQLGFNYNDALFGSVENMYQRIYDVSFEEIDAIAEAVFGPVPAWLEARRRL